MFRGNSLVTKGLDAYMKLVATPYLERVLGPTIRDIYTYKKTCEVHLLPLFFPPLLHCVG